MRSRLLSASIFQRTFEPSRAVVSAVGSEGHTLPFPDLHCVLKSLAREVYFRTHGSVQIELCGSPPQNSSSRKSSGIIRRKLRRARCPPRPARRRHYDRKEKAEGRVPSATAGETPALRLQNRNFKPNCRMRGLCAALGRMNPPVLQAMLFAS